MSKVAAAIAPAFVLLFAAAPSEAWQGGHGHFHGSHGTHVVVGVGPAFWWGPGPWYGPPYYAYAPPTVILEQPVYVERPSAAAPASGFWYYCESAGAYFPTVSTCAEPWVKVPPSPG